MNAEDRERLDNAIYDLCVCAKDGHEKGQFITTIIDNTYALGMERAATIAEPVNKECTCPACRAQWCKAQAIRSEARQK